MSARRACLGLACLFLFSLAKAGADSGNLPAWNEATQKAWWRQNDRPDLWPKAAQDLEVQLAGAYTRNGLTVFSDPSFQNWQEHLVWLHLALDHPEIVILPNRLAAFIALGQKPAVSHLLVRELDPRDDVRSALGLLLDLQEAAPADLEEYAALGVAYCLVFDQPFPDDWPHHQVQASAVPIGDLDVPQRFAFYVQANRARRLQYDLTALSVQELKLVVDSKIVLDELAYAQTERTPLSSLGDLFFQVRYDEARYRPPNIIFNWPFPRYTLAEIRQRSGICVDQAYYAAMIGKGRGIPTLRFTGLGLGGGHAWFGYLKSSGQWQLDCGRYELDNYPRGITLDPQTWETIDDTEIENFWKKIAPDPARPAARCALTRAALEWDSPEAEPALDAARQILPGDTLAWRLTAVYLEKNHASPERLKLFYEQWIAQFPTFQIMRLAGQKKLLALLQAAHDPDAAGLEQRMIVGNRDAGFDLGIESSHGAIFDRVEAHDWAGAQLEFKNVLNTFTAQGGATLFNEVIVPYTGACLRQGRVEQAQEAMRFAADRMRMESGTDLSTRFDELKRKVELVGKVSRAMLDWLGEIDRGSGLASWKEGSQALQRALDLRTWDAAVQTARTPLGNLQSRTLVRAPVAAQQSTLPNGRTIAGKCLSARFESVYDRAPRMIETVTMVEEGGTWRGLGYATEPAR